jgi:hypothetical protein
MASIRYEAQKVLSEARDGIAWIAVWKTGKSWHCEAFYPDYTEKPEAFAFEEYDQEKIDDIKATDPLAAFVNGWFDNLGDPDCMTRDSLADALRWQYESGHNRLTDINIKHEALAQLGYEEDDEEFDALGCFNF